MKDLNSNAEDCELIARLATDRVKRETFSRIATQLHEMAAELMADIAARSARVS
jgi:putative N-acetylmannosamine-6-phosphate epimerase